jgi:uncharacterized protein YjiS (DUF1127 family)
MTATTAVMSGSRRSVMRRISHVYGAFREARERRLAAQEMNFLDDGTLKDIGIHRSEITSLIHGDPRDRIHSYSGNRHD